MPKHILHDNLACASFEFDTAAELDEFVARHYDDRGRYIDERFNDDDDASADHHDEYDDNEHDLDAFLHAIDKFPADFYGADNDVDSRAAVVKLRAACDDYLNDQHDDDFVNHDLNLVHVNDLDDDDGADERQRASGRQRVVGGMPCGTALHGLP